MKKIVFIEVSDEAAEVFVADARHEMAYQRRLSRHKAQYSLDCDNGIEYSACLHGPTPQELLERMELFIRLCDGLPAPAKKRAVTSVMARFYFETKCPEAEVSLLSRPGRGII